MHDDALNPAGGSPAALSAFVRGVERRAYVFLWLQDGDAAAAEYALAAAIRAFAGPAPGVPMADWPARFWKLLAALPVGSGRQGRPPGLAFLDAMDLPARRALLLRQVAGLEEAAAADAMGLDGPAYRQALAAACPRDAGGGPDAEGWRRQAEAIQQAGRDLDAQQQQRLARLREAALAGRVPAATRDGEAMARPASAPRPPGRRGRILGSVLAMLVLGLAAAGGWWWSQRSPAAAAGDVSGTGGGQAEDLRVHDNGPIVVEPLPEPDPPAVPPDWPSSLPETGPDPVVAELALLSWYAAGSPATRLERETGEAPADGAQAPDATPDLAAADEAWRQLGAAEQALVRAAAARWQALEPPAQADLRARFALLDAMEQRGWRLGPALGADYSALQPLLGFVAEDERAPLLEALRAMTPGQRAQLGALAQRTPPAERQALRRQLLAQPPPQRAAWLEQLARQ